MSRFSPKRLLGCWRRQTKFIIESLTSVDPQSHFLMEDDRDKARVPHRQLSPVFVGQFHKINLDISKTLNQLNDNIFSVLEIERQFCILNAQSASVSDEIQLRAPKHLASVLVLLLENIFSKLMEMVWLPSPWKTTHVKPVINS